MKKFTSLVFRLLLVVYVGGWASLNAAGGGKGKRIGLTSFEALKRDCKTGNLKVFLRYASRHALTQSSRDASGDSLMHAAVRSGASVKILKFLIESDLYDGIIQNSEGLTVDQLAVALGEEFVNLLNRATEKHRRVGEQKDKNLKPSTRQGGYIGTFGSHSNSKSPKEISQRRARRGKSCRYNTNPHVVMRARVGTGKLSKGSPVVTDGYRGFEPLRLNDRVFRCLNLYGSRCLNIGLLGLFLTSGGYLLFQRP